MKLYLGILCSILCCQLTALANESINIPVGSSYRLPALGNIWVENGRVIKIEDNGDKINIKAMKTGQSLLRVGENNYIIYALSPAQSLTEKILQPVINKSLGLSLIWQGGQLYVNGRLSRWQDWQNLAEACAPHHCQYLMSASMQSSMHLYSLQQIQKTLGQLRLPAVPINRKPYFQTQLSDKLPQFSDLQNILGRYGIKVSKDSAALELAPLIQVHITFAEVKRETVKNYGIKWPSTYTAQILPSFSNSTDNQLASLQLLEKTGAGKILANPNIICRSGKEAEFLAGGEFPIKILNYKVHDVVWKKYGIVLRVKPLADYSGRMSISIETEVSSIDTSKTVDGIPGLYTNRVQSHFDLSESRTIALSGLIKSEQGRSAEGLPGLKNIPILGSLFASQDWRDQRTELVIFVRPEIINPSSDIDLPPLPEGL